MENEENSALFYQGTPAEYAAQLAAACAVAHERGVPCANGGLTGGLAALLLYDHYRRAGDEARAEDFRVRAFTAEQRVLLDTPRAQEQLNRGRELLARYQTVGLDYLNVHWYGADPAALVEVVEHLRAETGLPVLSNEVGQWNDDPAQTTAIMAAIVRLGLPIAVWYSVDGPRSRALVEPDVTLRPTGRAFQAFIARGMGEAPPSENPWGVSFGALVLDPARTPRALELAAAAGIGWVRFTFGYSRIARPDGDYVFTPYDALVAKAHAEGLQVLGTLGLAAEWNTTAPPGAPDLIRYPPRDEDAFAEYVARTVAHYPDIRYWELWNEPDLPGYWHGTPAQYARLLARTYQAVKQANPAAQVVLGGLALGGQRVNPDFLAALLADPDYPAARFFCDELPLLRVAGGGGTTHERCARHAGAVWCSGQADLGHRGRLPQRPARADRAAVPRSRGPGRLAARPPAVPAGAGRGAGVLVQAARHRGGRRCRELRPAGPGRHPQASL